MLGDLFRGVPDGRLAEFGRRCGALDDRSADLGGWLSLEGQPASKISRDDNDVAGKVAFGLLLTACRGRRRRRQPLSILKAASGGDSTNPWNRSFRRSGRGLTLLRSVARFGEHP